MPKAKASPIQRYPAATGVSYSPHRQSAGLNTSCVLGTGDVENGFGREGPRQEVPCLEEMPRSPGSRGHAPSHRIHERKHLHAAFSSTCRTARREAAANPPAPAACRTRRPGPGAQPQFQSSKKFPGSASLKRFPEEGVLGLLATCFFCVALV